MRRIIFCLCLVSGCLILLIASLSVRPAMAQSGKPPKTAASPSTLRLTTTSARARNLFEKAMVDYENLHLERSTATWRAAAKADRNFALAHAWIAFSSTDPVEVAAERERAKALNKNLTQGEQMMIQWIVGVQENNFVGGIAAMNDLLAFYPRDKRLFFLASNWLLNENENELAGKMCKRALAVDEDYPAALNNLAYAEARQNDFPAAFTAMERYIKVLPKEPNPQDSYAEILRMSGKFDAALQHYRAALKMDPKFHSSQLGLGDTYALMGDQVRARAEYAKAVQQDPDVANRLNYETQAAMTWVRENKLDQADKAFQAVAEKAHKKGQDLIEAKDHRLMAMYQESDAGALKHLEAAEAALSHQQEISQSDREEERARILRLRVFRATRGGEQEIAGQAMKQLEDMAQNSRSTVIQQSYHAAAGAVQMAQQKYSDAIVNLQEDNDDPFSLALLSHAYSQMGNSNDRRAVEAKLHSIHLPTMEQAVMELPSGTKQAGN
jgi:tetratricopeptide (TPR) repeat protein